MTKRYITQWSVLAIVTLLAGFLFAPTVLADETTGSIVDVAQADGRFTQLLGAAESTGLANMLASNGPFTLFAPTDDAFAALGADTVAGLSETELRQTLLYHIAQGEVNSADVAAASSVTTALGKDVSVSVVDGSVILNGTAEVIITDIAASNGVIHVIDAVLLPPSSGAFEPAADTATAPEAAVEEPASEEPVVEETIEEVEQSIEDALDELLGDLLLFDVEAYLGAMKSAEIAMTNMQSSLNGMSAGTYPTTCDDYYGWYVLLSFSTLDIAFSFPSDDYADIDEIVFTAIDKVFLSNEAIALLCVNGGNGHATSHNIGNATVGLTEGLESMRAAIRAVEERSGLSADDINIEMAEDALTQEEIDEILGELIGGFDAEVFYEDLLISQELIHSMMGWLDRVAAGIAVDCSDYGLSYFLLAEPAMFLDIPGEWEPLYSEHINVILTVLDSSAPLMNLCDNGGQLTQHTWEVARSGLVNANDRLHSLIQETEARLQP